MLMLGSIGHVGINRACIKASCGSMYGFGLTFPPDNMNPNAGPLQTRFVLSRAPFSGGSMSIRWIVASVVARGTRMQQDKMQEAGDRELARSSDKTRSDLDMVFICVVFKTIP